MSGVKIRGLSKTFGNGAPPAIDNLDLEIAGSEFFVLLGPSGCGKSTTLRCIAGLEEPDVGSIAIGERVVVDPREALFIPPNKRDIGMVFQSYGLWPHMTVYGNVSYPLRARGVAKGAIGPAVAEALALVNLSDYEDRYPSELSGGQQQRVALARAIVSNPRLLLFDEPLSNLDAQLRARLRFDLRRIHRDRRYTAVYVTHDQSEALSLADRIAVMRRGRIEQIGAPKDIFQSPATEFVAEFVGYDNFMPGVVVDSDGPQVTVLPDGWMQALIGRATTPVSPHQPVTIAMRSSAVRVARAATVTSGVNIASAVLQDVTYMGDRYLCVLVSNGHQLIGTLSIDAAARAAEQETPAGGQKVSVSLPVNEVIVLPRGSTEAVTTPTAQRREGIKCADFN